MYSADEIRSRFKGGIIVDRHGFEVKGFTDMQESTLFLRMAHYRLIDGMSKKQVRAKLIEFECSPFEADVVIEECLAFIKDVLQMDLDAHVKDLTSTIGQCNRLLMEVTEKANLWYEQKRFEPIELQGIIFDADQKSRDALNNVIATSSTPTYWTDLNNENVDKWTLTRTRQLLTAITQRDTELHGKVAELKRDMRIACEKLEIIKLQQFSLPE